LLIYFTFSRDLYVPISVTNLPFFWAVHKWFSASENNWGLVSFISLSDIKNPSSNFIVNDTLIVEGVLNRLSVLKEFAEGDNGAYNADIVSFKKIRHEHLFFCARKSP
jgi:hypothetical membrane protein